MDAEILILSEERARLLRRCNELKSPIRKYLPPEILSNIFRYASPPIDFPTRHFDTSERVINTYTSPLPDLETNSPYLPVLLGSVCSYWRQVAQSTPELWNTLVLDVRRRTAVNHAQLLQLCLSKSKALPLEVEMDFRREQRVNHGEPLKDRGNKIVAALRPIQGVLFDPDTMPKMRTLRLIAPPCEWLPLIPASFPNLEDLSLGWPFRFSMRPPASLVLDLSNLRRLTRVTLSREVKLVLPWSQITNLKLLCLPIHVCLDILFRCENLEKCRVRHIFAESRSDLAAIPALQGEPISLNRLQFLEWPPISVPLMITFFQRLHLPSLRRLRWEGISAIWGEGARESALGFFTRLPKTMTTLELVGDTLSRTAHQNSMIPDFLNTIPHLQILIVNGGIQLDSPLGHILETLGLDNPGSQTGGPFLPALRVLEIKIPPTEARLPQSSLLKSQLIKMLMNRHLRSDLGLSVKLNAELNWTDDQKEELRELVRAGFRLELWERNKSAKWIRPASKRREMTT